MARIAVEPSLTNIKEALMEMGHQVVDLDSEDDAEYSDCCVISGQDKDVMGIANTVISGPVINAQGENAEEVCRMINEKLT